MIFEIFDSSIIDLDCLKMFVRTKFQFLHRNDVIHLTGFQTLVFHKVVYSGAFETRWDINLMIALLQIFSIVTVKKIRKSASI